MNELFGLGLGAAGGFLLHMLRATAFLAVVPMFGQPRSARFMRIVIVLSFVRRALSVQDMPPNQVVIGLALFLTVVAMNPTLTAIWEGAVDPYMNDQLTMSEALDVAEVEMKTFMLRHPALEHQ